MVRFMTLLVALACVAQAWAQEQTVYPDGIGWINVKERYGAKGDGVTDDTEAIRAALKNRNEQYLDRVSLYFPDGVYLVSGELPYADGYYDCCVSIQGQSRAGTVFKLKDTCPGFGPGQTQAVFKTRAGNQSFHQNIRNVTIDVGRGNPGAIAVDYIANNTGVIRDVTIKAARESGAIGIAMTRSWPGPALISNVEIIGFDRGIEIGSPEYSMTFEHIRLRDQRSWGMVSDNSISVRDLHISGSPNGILLRGGSSVLIDCLLEGIAVGTAMGELPPNTYLRNVRQVNYPTGILVDGVNILGTIDELLVGRRFDLWPSEGLSLRLPVEETPAPYVNNDMNAWASIAEFGAVPSDPFFVKRVDNEAIQGAFNSGKPVVWLPITRSNGSCYGIDRPITVPQHVRLVTGFDQAKFCFFDSATIVVEGDGPEPLFLERMDAIRVFHVGKRPVVLRDIGLDRYTNVAGAGPVFIENVVGAFRPQHATTMWARQYNPEIQPYTEAQHENHGGRHWILGMKTEGFAELTRTTSGGSTEVLGGFVYPAQSHAEGIRPAAWVVDNAHLSVIHRAASYVPRGWYPVAVRETRGMETRELLVDSLPWPYLPLFTTGTSTNSVASTTTADPTHIVRLPDGTLRVHHEVSIISTHDVLGRACTLTDAPFPIFVTYVHRGTTHRVAR